IKKRFIPDNVVNQIKNSPGFVTVASEGVQFDEQYRNIVEHLLGSTIIAESLETANELARTIQFKHRIVTLDGDIITPGGAMTGGGKEKKASLLSQKDELKTTEDKYHNFMKQTTQVESKVKNLKEEIQQLEKTLSETQEKGTEHRASEHEETLQLDSILAKEKRVIDENETFEFEKNDGYNFIKGQETLKEKQSLLVEINRSLTSIDKKINQRSKLVVEKEINSLKIQDKKRLTEYLNENENTLTKILDQIELVNSDEYSGTSQFDEVEKHIEQSTNTKLEIETKMSEQQD